MSRPLRVFLSYTSELAKQPPEWSWLHAAVEAVRARGHVPVFMESFGSRDTLPRSVCDEKVESCQFWVGIIGHRYGSIVPETELSYTELEFDTATSAGLHRLALLLADDAPVGARDTGEAHRRQQSFRLKASEGRLATSIGTPARLFADLYDALSDMEGDRPQPEILDALPPVVPTGLRDRHGDRARLASVLERGQDRVVVLLGGHGDGKTAMVSQLVRDLAQRGGESPFGIYRYFSADGHVSVTGPSLLKRLVEALPPGDQHNVLLHRLAGGHGSWYDLVHEVLDAHAEDVLVVLDQVENLLDDQDLFVDRMLGQLIKELSSRDDHRVSILLVSTRVPSPRLLGHRREAVVELQCRLAEDSDTWDLLRDLAPTLPPAVAEDPDALVRLADRHPRTLQLLLALFDGERPIEHMGELPDLDGLDPGLRIAALVAVLQQRMSPGLRAVLRVLAVLGLPATVSDVCDVLPDDSAHPGPDEVSDLLALAERLRLVTPAATRLRHAAPAWVVPAAEGRVIVRLWRRTDGGDAGYRYVAQRAADHLALTKDDKLPRTVEDLDRHLREVFLRLDTEQYPECTRLMNDLDEQYLKGWGQSHVLAPWRRRLLGWAAGSHYWRTNLSWMVIGALEVEDFRQAWHLLDEVTAPTSAAVLRRGPSEARQAQQDEAFLLGLRGTTALREGRIDVATDWYTRARHQSQDPTVKAGALAGLGVCASELGRTEQARRHYDAAQQMLTEATDRTSWRDVCQLLLVRADLARMEGDLAAAEELVREALAATRASDPRIRVRCYDLRAACKLEASLDSARADRLVDEAVADAERAAALAAETGGSDLRRTALALLATAHLRRLSHAPESADALGSAHAAAVSSARLNGSKRALVGYVALGMVCLRDRRRPGAEQRARDAFYRALAMGDRYDKAEGRPYWVWDNLALAHTGLHLCRVDDAERAAVLAFDAARRLAPARGAARRAELLLRTLGADSSEAAIGRLLLAARGAGELPATKQFG